MGGGHRNTGRPSGRGLVPVHPPRRTCDEWDLLPALRSHGFSRIELLVWSPIRRRSLCLEHWSPNVAMSHSRRRNINANLVTGTDGTFRRADSHIISTIIEP